MTVPIHARVKTTRKAVAKISEGYIRAAYRWQLTNHSLDVTPVLCALHYSEEEVAHRDLCSRNREDEKYGTDK